jgi:hypothetical protein
MTNKAATRREAKRKASHTDCVCTLTSMCALHDPRQLQDVTEDSLHQEASRES